MEGFVLRTGSSWPPVLSHVVCILSGHISTCKSEDSSFSCTCVKCQTCWNCAINCFPTTTSVAWNLLRGNVCYEGLHDMRLCLCDVLCRNFGGTFCLHFPCIKVLVRLEDGGNIFIQNICICLENQITSHSWRPFSQHTGPCSTPGQSTWFRSCTECHGQAFLRALWFSPMAIHLCFLFIVAYHWCSETHGGHDSLILLIF